MEFGSVITAMATPFNDSLAVDYARAAELARFLADNGSAGVLIAGTTGESPTLTLQERTRLLETVLEAVGDRIMVMAGTGTNSTADSIELTKRAEAIGAHAILLVTPYYNKPPQDGLYEHFAAIAAATRLPVMLYNVPGRTAANLLPATVARLAEIDNIVALKEASGNLDQMSELRRVTPPEFMIYSGDDSLTLPMMACGARGVVSVISHVAGNQVRAMCDAVLAGDLDQARRLHLALHPLAKALFVTTNPIPVKAALAMIGLPVGGCRPPLSAASERDLATVRAALGELGLLR
ncbi:MAG: 4-hydroxy-tetrahydrodipicolinate synthase [Chloroflexota bacterium]